MKKYLKQNKIDAFRAFSVALILIGVIFFTSSIASNLTRGGQPPVADAGPDQNATVNQLVFFSGNGSYDPDNDPLSYKWDFADGNSTGWLFNSTTNHSYTLPGNYTVTLNVTDGSLFDVDTCIIQINSSVNNNTPPVANAGADQNTVVYYPVLFNGNGSYDPDNDPLSYKWDFGDGSFTDWTSTTTAYHKYSTAGNYSVTLYVSDGITTDTDNCNVSVRINNHPVAEAGSDQFGNVSQLIFFDGSGSYDLDGDPLIYKWDFGDGTSTGWQNNCNSSHIYNNTGNYIVRLNVWDGWGMVSDVCYAFISTPGGNNTPPVADAGPDHNVTIQQQVYFDGSGSYDPDGDPLSYKWDYGDGTFTGWQNNSNTSRSYNKVGNYTVTLSVTDDKAMDFDICIVHVKSTSSGNSPPVADAGPNQNGKTGQTIFFDGSGSYDPDNDPLQYKWFFGDNTSTGWQNNCNSSHIYNSPGFYYVTLYVNDGKIIDSDFCVANITNGSSNPAPPPPRDSDGDGYDDTEDDFPFDPGQWKDSDSDGFGDNLDGYKPDMFPFDPYEWSDQDGDGVGDNSDEFPYDPTEWKDTDNDRIGDNSDLFPNDPMDWQDTDGDGVGDNSDAFPNNPLEWSDLDGDRVGDNSDAFPNDPTEWQDADGDGVGDNSDAFPNDPLEWSDLDGDRVGDNSDTFPNDPTEWQDSDGDGYGDNSDAFPNNALEWSDFDGDRIGDNSDEYPEDSTNHLNEKIRIEKDQDYFSLIFMLLIIFVIIMIILVFLLIRSKDRDSKQIEDDDYSKDNYSYENVSYAGELYDIEMSNDEIKLLLENKYQKGDISKDTYDYIFDNVVIREQMK